jgi:hypothetical protein
LSFGNSQQNIIAYEAILQRTFEKSNLLVAVVPQGKPYTKQN